MWRGWFGVNTLLVPQRMEERQPLSWMVSMTLLGLLFAQFGGVHMQLPSPEPPTIQNVTLAAILPKNNADYAWAWPRVGPALTRALEHVNSDPSLLPGHRLVLIFNGSDTKEGKCSETVAPLAAVDFRLSHNPWAFIGPGCDYAAGPVGRFTGHWHVPLVTAGAAAIGFEEYTSITNMGPTYQKLGEFVVEIHQNFGWKHAMLVYHDHKNDDRPCYFTVEGLYQEMTKENITFHPVAFDEMDQPVDYKDLMTNIRDQARGKSAQYSIPVFKPTSPMWEPVPTTVTLGTEVLAREQPMFIPLCGPMTCY